MRTKIKRMAAVVAAAHIMLIAVFCLLSMGSKLVQRDTPSAVEVSFFPPGAPASAQPLLGPSLLPSPVIPTGAPPSAVASRPTRPPLPSIVRSTTTVVRVPTQQAMQPPTAEQIQDELLAALSSPGREVSVPGDGPSDMDLEILHAAYYGVWTPPPKHEVGDAAVTALVVFGLDGRVREATVIAASGNHSLDASVSLALGRLLEVPGLSPAILRREEGVTITFTVAQ